MSVHTRRAQLLVTGRRADSRNGKPPIFGLMRFATMLGPITAGSRADDPYADWWLVGVEQRLHTSRDALAELRAQLDQKLASAPAFDVQIAESISPVTVDLTFQSPYAFMGAYLLADYDALVRAALTARHVALVRSSEAERLMAEGGRAVRSAYVAAHGYRYLAATRHDLRQNTPKAQRARQLLGPLPQQVVDGELRPAHAPSPSASDAAKRSDNPGPADGLADTDVGADADDLGQLDDELVAPTVGGIPSRWGR